MTDRKAAGRRRLTPGLIISALLAILPVMPAHAQVSWSGPWSMTPFVGQAFAGDLDERVESFGGAVARRFGSDVGLEAELGFVPRLVSQGTESDVVLLAGHVLYHPTERVLFQPYGSVGGAFVRLTSGAAQADASTDVAMTLGGGGWVAMREWMALRVDARFFHVNNAPNFWRVYGGITFVLGR